MAIALLIIFSFSILILFLTVVNGWYVVPLIWILTDLVIFAGYWFAVIIIKPRYPEWWGENIVGVVE